jgi:hypothetical protein
MITKGSGNGGIRLDGRLEGARKNNAAQGGSHRFKMDASRGHQLDARPIPEQNQPSAIAAREVNM